MNNYQVSLFNPLNTELNPICHLLTLLGAHHIFHVSGLRVKQIIAFRLWKLIQRKILNGKGVHMHPIFLHPFQNSIVATTPVASMLLHGGKHDLGDVTR